MVVIGVRCDHAGAAYSAFVFAYVYYIYVCGVQNLLPFVNAPETS